MSTEKITLPFPPSVNSLYATDFKTKRRFKTKRYAEWCKAAETQFSPGITFHCPVKVVYLFGRPDKRKRDLSNLFKACDDFLVDQKVIDDDSDIHEIHASWGNVVGVEMEIFPLEA